MLKQQLKGCLGIVLTFMILGVIAIFYHLSAYFLSDSLLNFLLPAVIAFVFALFVSSSVYRYTMRRYNVLAPDDAYEYNKMASISYTKDDMKFVRKTIKI